MGLLDYYKQFEAVSEEEINRELREEAAERKARELMRVDALDLSKLTCHDPLPGDVVSAITFAARRGLNAYPRGSELLSELAHRHSIPEARIAIGNGASELLQAAASALMQPQQALLTPWPSHPLFPAMARRAHGSAVPVSGGVDALLAAVPEHETRVLALASPNDPTGELLSAQELERLLAALPETVAVLLDEALVEYADRQEQDATLSLLERYPRLLVFRSFSKAWGLAGLRCGYVLGGPGAEDLLAALTPAHGVSELAQAGALECLRSCEDVLSRRVGAVCEQRSRLTAALRERGLSVSASQANLLWAAHPDLDSGALTAALEQAGVLVAPGAPLGQPRHVRIAIRDAAATDRLLSAIDAIDERTATAA